jgi:hypothetical protein
MLTHTVRRCIEKSKYTECYCFYSSNRSDIDIPKFANLLFFELLAGNGDSPVSAALIISSSITGYKPYCR